MKKRIFSLILVVALCMSYLPTTAFATGHVHDDTCGYQPEVACGHTTHDAACGYAEAVAGAACNHAHGDCSYIAASNGTPCGHSHDTNCRYVEAKPCSFTPCDHSTCGYVAGSPCSRANCDHSSCGYDESNPDSYCPNLGCDHQPQDNCGYVEGVECSNAGQTCDHSTCGYTEGSPCNHTEHTDCGYSAPVEGVACDHSHNTNCGYVEAVEAKPCTHSHDVACGYSEGSPCTYVAPTTYTVTYTDGVDGEIIFEDQPHTDLLYGSETPAYEGPEESSTPTRDGFTFAGWSPEVATTVTGDATYTAQWTADAPDTPDPLTITVSSTYLIGGGTITITTSKPADQVTADFEDGLEDGLIKITTNNKINWTATIPDHILGRTYFIATDENGSVESAEVNFSPTFWINPTSETLTGGGTVTLVTAVPVSSVTCDADGINVQGRGDEWTATLPNRTATYTFTATLDNYTASCTVSVTYSATGSSSSSDDSDDDDDYAPSDDAGNESGNNTQPQPETPPADESGYVRQQQDPLDTVYTVPVTGEQTVQVTADVTEDEDGRVQVSILPLTPEQLAVLGDAPTVIIDLTGVEDTGGIEAAIPGQVVQDISEGTQGDVQLKTPIADVMIGHDAIAENAGELVMEARRTEDGISTKVSIGGVTVIDTGVKLPEGVDLPEDGKLVVGTLQPGADALNFLPLTETTEPSTRMAMVPEDIIKSTDAAVIGPDGGSYTQHERLLINGKEYYVSGSGDGESLSLYDKEGNIYSYDGEKDPQEIGQNAGTEYPENEFISINGAVYQIHSVQRDTDGNGTLILYLDGKPAGMCQFDQYEEMDSINIYNENYAPDKVRERQQNSNQLGTVTTGESPIDGLVSGKTYNVSVIGSQDISVPGYDEAVLNSIKAETEAEKAAREKVERLKADMEAKEAAMDQLWRETGHLDYWYAVIASEDAEAAYEAALAELAALANLQSATVTQTFDIPNELVGRTDVTFAAVHNTNPFPVPGSSIRDDIANFIEEWHKQWEETYSPEIGTVEVSEDGQTLTATYTVSSFSPFTIYAFTEADEPEVTVPGPLAVLPPKTGEAPGIAGFLMLALGLLGCGAMAIRRRSDG